MSNIIKNLSTKHLVKYSNLPGLYGAAGSPGDDPAGFAVRSDVIPTVPGRRGLTLDGQSHSDIWTELLERNAAFNRTMGALMSLLVYNVDRAQDRVAIPSNNGFEEATEFGQPRKRRVQYVFRGFPLRHVDTGVGYSQEFLDSANSREILALSDDVEMDWTRENLIEALNAIFQDSNVTDMDGISIKRLYNNDGEVPPKWKTYTHAGSHTHYLTSAALDLAAMAAAELHLTHHGFDGQMYTLANKVDVDTIRGLTGFVPAVSADRPIVVDGNIIGGTSPTSLGGLAVQGYLGKSAIVEEDEIPSGYLVNWSTGGTLSPRNILGMRVHENSSARGLRLVQGTKQDYPLFDAYWDGYLGAGVRQRGGAVVTQITGGAYTAPTLS